MYNVPQLNLISQVAPQDDFPLRASAQKTDGLEQRQNLLITVDLTLRTQFVQRWLNQSRSFALAVLEDLRRDMDVSSVREWVYPCVRCVCAVSVHKGKSTR